MPAVRKIQDRMFQLRTTAIHDFFSPAMDAARAEQAGMVYRAKPRKSSGGWKIMPGLRSSGFRPRPSAGAGMISMNGFDQPVSRSRKNACTVRKNIQKKSLVPSLKDL